MLQFYGYEFFNEKIKIRYMESECEIKYININKTRFTNSFFSTFANQFSIIIFKMADQNVKKQKHHERMFRRKNRTK